MDVEIYIRRVPVSGAKTDAERRFAGLDNSGFFALCDTSAPLGLGWVVERDLGGRPACSAPG